MRSSALSETEHRRKLFGRRKGHALSAHQTGLIETLLPRLELKLEPGSDPLRYFPGAADVWLEIGFGAGEHLHWQAAHHPDIGIIGAEPYVSGVAKLLSRLDKEPRANIRLHMEDARDILLNLPDASLGRIFILFPDPWPKARHHKRRFIQTEMLDEFSRVLRRGAELRFASDDPGYLTWALERLIAHPDFTWTARSPADWQTRPDDWPATRYEAKRLHGPPVFLRFIRRS